jgi:hypothetical protein
MVGLLKQTSQEAEIQSAGNQASDVARFNPSTPPSFMRDQDFPEECAKIAVGGVITHPLASAKKAFRSDT